MDSYPQVVSSLRAVFRSGRTKTLEWRQAQLGAMLKMLDENRDKFADALKNDLNKGSFEALLFEVDLARNDLITCMNNLSEWIKPEKAKKALMNIMDKLYIRSEPYGVALIIGAWNYPVQLTLLPMIGAIAAGNCVVLKPSELSENTARLLGELMPKYFDTEAVVCINGAVAETTALLMEKWDYIFYTGNSAVGKIIMKAAAEYLTPVTLELGGKSPVYVDSDTDLAIVANRILWGKCTNSGQTCIAPDYVMCTKETQDALVEKMKETLAMFYPEGVEKSPDYCRIVNDRHFQRVKKLVGGGGKVAIGGNTNEKERFMAPTVLSDVSFSDSVMQDEIFGPVLPIVPVQDEDEAISHILDGEKPLSMYVYSNNQVLIDKMATSCSSGGLCVNDCLIHAGAPSLPFGGVGNSGTGAYHGKFSFDTFSHKRGCMERKLNMEGANKLRYPPFTDKNTKRILWLTQKKLNAGSTPWVRYFIIGTLIAVVLKAKM